MQQQDPAIVKIIADLLKSIFPSSLVIHPPVVIGKAPENIDVSHAGGQFQGEFAIFALGRS